MLFKMFQYLIKFSLISLLFVTPFTTESAPCGDWLAYKDEKCFKVFDSVAPEETAETICNVKDNISVLAIIKTSEEQDFIEKYLKASKIEDNVWIGIKKTNNSFKWLDGTDVKYTNWDKDKPLKGSNDQNCVGISVEQSNFGKWMDEKCGKKNAVLCEKIQPWSVERLQNILLEERSKNKDLFVSQKTEINSLKSEFDNINSKAIPDQQKAIDSYKKELDNQQKLIIEHKNELDALKKKTIPAQQKLIDSQKAEINKLISNPVPIGFIYVQLSGQSEPNTLWPNTEWQNISKKYSGLFFRAEGGQSSTFGETQEQQTQSLEFCTYKAGNNGDYGKWTKITEKENEKYMYTGQSCSDCLGIMFRHNTDEIRPRNQAIRIWQRIK